MSEEKEQILSLLDRAGVAVNGGKPWDVTVHDERVYERVLKDKILGLGESYVEGWWDCPRLDEFYFRLFTSDVGTGLFDNLKLFLKTFPIRLLSLQRRRKRSEFEAIIPRPEKDFYFSFLDPYYQFSSGYYKDDCDLAQAQIHKMRLILQDLNPKSNERLLDIGCGWGGLLKFAVQEKRISATGVCEDKDQADFARSFCTGLPVRIFAMDYRDLKDKYDKIACIEFFECLTFKEYRPFMRLVHRNMRDDGLFLLQAAGVNRSGRGHDPWVHKYIHPDGRLPSLTEICRASEGYLNVEQVRNIGDHYAQTLLHWYDNLRSAWPEMEDVYGNEMKRIWDYYLLSGVGALRAGELHVWQILFSKHGGPHPGHL